jgi:hypothetical protein
VAKLLLDFAEKLVPLSNPTGFAVGLLTMTAMFFGKTSSGREAEAWRDEIGVSCCLLSPVSMSKCRTIATR